MTVITRKLENIRYGFPNRVLSGTRVVMSSVGHQISLFFGWSYTFAWSLSFWPQVLLNWKRKSVQGLSLDFVALNVWGFLCYTVFNLAFYTSDEIQREYREHHGGQNNLVQLNDVFFSLHAFILATITYMQTLLYKRDAGQIVSAHSYWFIWWTALVSVLLACACLLDLLAWIYLMYYLSFVKLAVSSIKYIPQAIHNFQRKSTRGWSIYTILLDFIGGFLSNAQLLLDSWLDSGSGGGRWWAGVAGDPVKLGLGILSMSMDVVFIVQHYVLYPEKDWLPLYLKRAEERKPLLS
ncbi:uncharacterized protein VTP21DRAFT_8885 [Calcarisporiella thermophila]|uniref:uncharacterized protein n=1 Tax=Calcarisporiella thermophila TaxID=911321 RepID=UPI0037434E39